MRGVNHAGIVLHSGVFCLLILWLLKYSTTQRRLTSACRPTYFLAVTRRVSCLAKIRGLARYVAQSYAADAQTVRPLREGIGEHGKK